MFVHAAKFDSSVFLPSTSTSSKAIHLHFGRRNCISELPPKIHPGVDVTIALLSDFRQYVFGKKWWFSQKTM
jgi:hypothetical protein